MKKVSVRVECLNFKPANLVLGKSPKLFKLDFEQAVTFQSVSLARMQKLYQPLRLNEAYTGYVGVYRSKGRGYVVYMDGLLQRVGQYALVSSEHLDAALDGRLYTCVRNGYRGQYGLGQFDLIFTFGTCHFADWAKKLKSQKRLKKSVLPKAIDKSLKEKLMLSVQEETEVCLTDDEAFVLETFLSDKFYRYLISEN